MVHDPSESYLSGVSALTRFFVIATVLYVSACTVPIRPMAVPPMPQSPLPDARIWIRGDEPADQWVCVELFEPNSLFLYRCVTVRTLRSFVNGLTTAN